MTQMISERSQFELMEIFMDLQEKRLHALRKLDVPRVNSIVSKLSVVENALSSTREGRTRVENLLRHESPYLRARAAGVVMGWDPAKAIPIFGALLNADLTPISSVDERLDIRLSSKEWLFKHFGIRNADRNALIEPLRAYGIELPYKDRSWEH